jgi:nucleotide-binding universal stress UspA family protein
MATVVVGVDGSLHSVVAAHWAAAEAARRGAELLLMAGCYHLGHAPEPGESYAETEARARAMLASVALDEADRFPEIQVRYEAAPELPVAALLAAQQDADLLVVGSRGLGASEACCSAPSAGSLPPRRPVPSSWSARKVSSLTT